VHQISFPVSLVLSAIRPFISAKAIDLIFFPLTLVLVPLCPMICAYSVFLPVRIIPYVCAAIWPFRLTLATLNVVQPNTFVNCSVLTCVDAIAIWFVVYEITLKNVAISVPKCALALRPVVDPIPLVLGPINPSLNTVPMSYAAEIFSLWVCWLTRLKLPPVNTAIGIYMFISVNQVIMFKQKVWI
jgi:hypothetical protein